MNDAEETTAEVGGWSVCPICGAVIADIDAHVLYHEQMGRAGGRCGRG